MQVFDELGRLLVNTAEGAVAGPFSSTDNAVPRWDGIDGDLLQNSSLLVSDTTNSRVEVHVDTVDGADIGYLALGGGGACGDPRGAWIQLLGNEYAGAGGYLGLRTGDVQGALMVFYVEDSLKLSMGTSSIVWNDIGIDVDFRWEGASAPNALFIQGSDGKIGIGTAVIPHGGIGYAILALEGLANDPNGPYIQITQSGDDYPAFQLGVKSHDSIEMFFDAYWDGAWRSSDVGSNFFIVKMNDVFQFGGDTAIAQGNVISLISALAITKDNNVAVGTTQMPRGAIGYAKFGIHGTDSNAVGPHVQITTSVDDYPLLQLYNWAHDEIGIIFDAYYDGAWKSSDAGSSFRIGKGTSVADVFSIEYDIAAQGAAITWNDGIVLTATGKVGIGTAVIPHGGVGLAQIAIDGTAPYIQITTTADDYPIHQIASLAHDNLAIGFDSYWDGAWKSGDAGSSFQIYKVNDQFQINYDVAAQGAAITWNNGIVLDTSGRVMIQTTTPKGSFTVDAADNQTSFCMNWETMADDASIALETYITSNSGILFVIASENLAAGSFFIQGGGNAVTIINDSKTNLSITDVDGKVCVIPDGDSTYTLKNRLGGAYQIRFMFFGN